jgi:hypothetical protein
MNVQGEVWNRTYRTQQYPQSRSVNNPARWLANADKQRIRERRSDLAIGSTSFPRYLNVDPCQSGGLRRRGELDSMAEFHLIANDLRNHDCFQIFEPHFGRWRSDDI